MNYLTPERKGSRKKIQKILQVHTVKSTVKISSIFVAFLENMNFTCIKNAQCAHERRMPKEIDVNEVSCSHNGIKVVMKSILK